MAASVAGRAVDPEQLDLVTLMRTRLNIVVITFVCTMVLLLLVVTHGRGPTPVPLAAIARVAEGPTSALPTAAAVPLQSPAVVAAPVWQKATYTAQWGDTVSNLAAEMPGGNLKPNRDAVINANESLQQNPDRLLAGSTYAIPANADVPATQPVVKPTEAAVVTATVVEPAATPVVVVAKRVVEPAATPVERADELAYVARAGDNVSVLAHALLGEDNKENRDAIVASNPSLQRNVDYVVDGQTYRIPVRESRPLSAGNVGATVVVPSATPTGPSDADDVIAAGSARDLRYVAKPGDTVSTLAVALLGSDTPANRAAIVENNRSLVRDADRVVAGKTYWIKAPEAVMP